ncbi:MAG: hypothetical protein QW506_04940, partial [Thermoproteota archaeon]
MGCESNPYNDITFMNPSPDSLKNVFLYGERSGLGKLVMGRQPVDPTSFLMKRDSKEIKIFRYSALPPLNFSYLRRQYLSWFVGPETELPPY